MNNPNPFVPKGSLLEQQSQRRSRLKIAVGCILAVSVTGLVATLILGCKRENPETQTPPADTNNAPAFDMTSTSNAAIATGIPAVPMQPAISNTAPVALPPVLPPAQPPVQPPAVENPGTTYEVVGGDTLGKIAKAHGVSLKALEAANPGVDSKKLKIKQKINIPAPTPSAAAPASATSTGPAETGGETYTVKPGDTLSKIVKSKGVTLKELRAANPKIASTDHIRVGDKLTIPAKAPAAAPTPALTPDTSATPALPPMQVPPPTSPANPAR